MENRFIFCKIKKKYLTLLIKNLSNYKLSLKNMYCNEESIYQNRLIEQLSREVNVWIDSLTKLLKMNRKSIQPIDSDDHSVVGLLRLRFDIDDFLSQKISEVTLLHATIGLRSRQNGDRQRVVAQNVATTATRRR